MKYMNFPCLAGDLAVFLRSCVTVHYSRVFLDAVTYVPLHPRKGRERTFNQCALLARKLAGLLGLPLAAGLLSRTRFTQTQTDLSPGERRRNVANAFQAVKPSWIEGRRFLLVDDVMTTGSTVNEVSRTLKLAGAAAVYVATVARG